MTIGRRRKGTHVERSPWTKRIAWTVGILLLMAATAAIAVLISRQDATDTITAESIGNVDIGNAATDGVFAVDLSRIQPGDTHRACVGAQLTSPTGFDAPRLYAADGSGALADDLTITLGLYNRDKDAKTGIGQTTCATSNDYTEIFTGTVADFLATLPDYATGQSWFVTGNSSTTKTELEVVLTLPSTVDAGTVAGDSATLAIAFENQGG